MGQQPEGLEAAAADLCSPGCLSDAAFFPLMPPNPTTLDPLYTAFIKACFFLREICCGSLQITILSTLSVCHHHYRNTHLHCPSAPPQFLLFPLLPVHFGYQSGQFYWAGSTGQLMCLQPDHKHCLSPSGTPEHLLMIPSFLLPF